MCASIPGFSTFNVSHLSPDVTTKNVSRHDQCSPGGQVASLVYANSGEKSLSQMPAVFSGVENSCPCGGRIPQQGQDPARCEEGPAWTLTLAGASRAHLRLVKGP